MTTLQELIEDLGYSTRSYSGRGMYGKYCLGVTLDAGSESRFLLELGMAIGEFNADPTNELEQTISLPNRVSSDSMGLDRIIYFPNVEYVGEGDDDEDDTNDENDD